MKRFTILIALVLFIPVFGCGKKEVRQPVVAGAFYPADPAKLERMVDGYLADAPKVDAPGQLIALIVPHAGYMYSGLVAANAFKQMEGSDCDTVILLGPSHKFALRGASVYTGDAFVTPIGEVPVDTRLAKSMLDQEHGVVYEPRAHAQEHSLEVELPFLQKTLDDFSIVPIVVGSPDKPMMDSLTASIADELSERPGRSVVVVSTDWSHYKDYDTAVAMDGLAIEAVEDLSSFELMVRSQTRRIELCGIFPTMLAMDVAGRLGADTVRVFKYANSGDSTGERSSVVGYAAIGIYRAGGGGEGKLSPAQRAELLSIAKKTVEGYVRTGSVPDTGEPGAGLDVRRGAFVTLKKDGQLRGCIGNFFSDDTLAESVRDMAVNASARDYRFRPVAKEELKDITVEVSVLSPLRKITSVEEVRVGEHGLYIIKGGRSGVLLPQVPVEQGWDRDTFIAQTCLKAGLPPDAWREGADLYVFTAEVFGEDHPD